MNDEMARMGSVSSIVRDGGDYIVSFYTNGVIRLRTTPEQSVKYATEHINIPCGVFSLLRDARQEIVWIGTDGQGLYQHTRNATAFRSITFNQLPYNLSKPVRALYIDDERTLWVGTKGEGILRIADFYDRKEFTPAHVQQLTADNSELLDNSVYAFARSRRNLLWIGTDGEGLNYYSYDDRRIRTLRTPAPLKYIHALYETSPDTLWVATVGCGVFRVTLGGTASQPSIRGVEQLHFNDELEIKNFFFTLYPENGSAMWFGNRGGGAVRYDIAGGGSEVFKFDAGRSAIANDIFAIHRSGDGTMWFGTSGGLIEFRRDSTSHVPGIRNTVHGILEDRKGDLWLSTNRGLVQYSPHTGYVVTYGYSYGLNTIEYSDGACFADPRTGTLFFGGIDGLVTIEDTGFREQEYNPPMLFRDIRLNDGIRNIGDMLSRDGVLTLRHGQRIFEITVSALDYVNGSNYSYYSRLDGYNDQWTGASSQLSFADLPAGTYRLDVRYRNNITGAESPVYSLPIRLKPAWYATAAARCLYVLLLLAVVGGVIRHYLLRYRRRRAEKLQRLEIRRKEEVYESKMRFFSNITQELSMPLTMISAPCQQILAYRKADPYVLKYAQTIRQNVSKLHDLIYMLHEFRGIRTGQNDESENIELVPVAEIAQSMVETFGEYSQQNSIHCQLDIERNLVWPTDRDGLSTILNTLLSNAFKHTPYNGAVSLTIRSDNGKLLISASNDSVGVNLEDIEAIFDRYRVLDYFERKSERGLSFQGDLRLAICHSIVVRMQGEIKVESTPNAQTTFTVLLPQLKVTAENTPAADNIVPASKEYGLPLPTVTRREFPFDKNRRTVFIVNDNSEIMNFVAELFAADYNIKMPSGKTEMIELLKQMHPDIVICDALSEQSDCLSLIQFIKQGKLTSHIPVILLSTAQQIDERIKGVESGADICLTLPFNVEYLKAVAEQLLRRNRSLKDYYKSSISAFELSDGRMLHQDDKEFIDRMLKIINDNISNTEISTKFIADELGVSIRNLYRRLEGILNQTPTNIIKEYRLAKAEQLLTTTKLSIDEIIYKAGFVNRGTFFKCFSAKYGCTPKVYRKEKLSQIRQEVGEESEDAADRSA
ncbi:two-component regulator propeller domain-containing protein [Alistipes finegoldii]